MQDLSEDIIKVEEMLRSRNMSGRVRAGLTNLAQVLKAWRQNADT